MASDEIEFRQPVHTDMIILIGVRVQGRALLVLVCLLVTGGSTMIHVADAIVVGVLSDEGRQLGRHLLLRARIHRHRVLRTMRDATSKPLKVQRRVLKVCPFPWGQVSKNSVSARCFLVGNATRQPWPKCCWATRRRFVPKTNISAYCGVAIEEVGGGGQCGPPQLASLNIRV